MLSTGCNIQQILVLTKLLLIGLQSVEDTILKKALVPQCDLQDRTLARELS